MRGHGAALGLAAFVACTPPAPPVAGPKSAPIARVAPAPSAKAAGGEAFRYEVEVSSDATALDVAVTLPRGPAMDFAFEDGGERFVRGLAYRGQGAAIPLREAREGKGEDDEPIGPCFHVPACAASTCRLSYRFDLGAAADRIDDVEIAAARSGAFLAPPSTWLAHPELSSEGRAFTLRVRTPPGVAFASGLAAGGAGDGFAADVSDLPKAPYGAIGAIRMLHWEKNGFAVDVARLPGTLAVDDAALLRWVDRAAGVVLAWAKRPPIPRALVLVVPSSGHGIGFARTLGNGGASVLVPLGAAATEADLLGGWELVHELLHVAFPNLPNEQSWLEEGMATFVEPFARARAGLIGEAEVWDRLGRRLPFGTPSPGDGGLDGSRSWGKVYWGALFCLVADLEIRRATNNGRSLDDALRGVLAAGGNVAHRWDVAKVIEVGDAATGTRALAKTYAAMGPKPGTVDVGALLGELGVGFTDGALRLDERAPLAAFRRAMVAR
jgi:hypothetical protein